MNYKLKEKDGKVEFLLRTGKDFVRNHMSVASAQHIIDGGKLMKSTKVGYPICVNDEWFFEGEIIKKSAPKKNDEDEK